MTGRNLEYSQLQELLKNSDPTSVYEELMKKESDVLKTINRVVNVSNEKEIKAKEFGNMSFNDLIHKLFWNLKLMSSEMYEARTVQDLHKIFLKDDRKMYSGIFLVVISIFIFFILISI